MTWTVNNNLRNALGHGGSIADAFAGSKLQIFDSESNLLSEHNIGAVTGTNNVVNLSFVSAIVEDGVDDDDAATAQLIAADDAVLLSTDDVGSTGADIPFPDDGHEGWSEGDVVQPGNATLTFTLGIAP